MREQCGPGRSPPTPLPSYGAYDEHRLLPDNNGAGAMKARRRWSQQLLWSPTPLPSHLPTPHVPPHPSSLGSTSLRCGEVEAAVALARSDLAPLVGSSASLVLAATAGTGGPSGGGQSAAVAAAGSGGPPASRGQLPTGGEEGGGKLLSAPLLRDVVALAAYERPEASPLVRGHKCERSGGIHVVLGQCG